MKTFLTDDFLLHSDVARELYHDHARDQPIIDYHCHLPPDEVAQDKRFSNITEAWLAGEMGGGHRFRSLKAFAVYIRWVLQQIEEREAELAEGGSSS